MLGLFTTIGVLLLIFSIIMIFVKPMLRVEDEKVEGSYGESKTIKKAPSFLLMMDLKKCLIGICIGLFLTMSNALAFNVPLGYSASIQFPNGSQVGVTTPGYHFKWLGTVQLWKNYMTVKYENVKQVAEEEEISEDAKDQKFSGKRPAIAILFNDAVNANVTLSARCKLPSDPERFLETARQYRNPENLINSTILPSIKNVVENTAYIYSAQEYIVGRAGEMKIDITYQLQNGNYILKRKKHANVDPKDIVTDSSRTVDAGRKEMVRYVSEKTYKNGRPVVGDNALINANIEIVQATVEKVLMEKTFRELLQKQRDQAAKANLAKQEAQTAEFTKQKIIAEGERDKAKNKVAEEMKQITVLIGIETQTKKALEGVKQQKAILAVKKLKAEQIRVTASAEAFKNRQLVSAGLTPQQKEEFRNERAIGIAAEFAKTKFPSTYITGQTGKNGGSMLTDLIGADYATKMLNTK